MTDKELYLGIGLPVLAVLTSLIISLIQISGIREDMRQMRTEFANGLAEMRREAREDRLRIADDIKMLTGKLYELMDRK